jgi:hypothetical protein
VKIVTAQDAIASKQELEAEVKALYLAADSARPRNSSAQFDPAMTTPRDRLRVLALAQEEGNTFNQTFRRLFDLTLRQAEHINRRTTHV